MLAFLSENFSSALNKIGSLPLLDEGDAKNVVALDGVYRVLSLMFSCISTFLAYTVMLHSKCFHLKDPTTLKIPQNQLTIYAFMS